ncbi:MAG TPA: DUF1345 domain-containing protein [Sphingomicrobium sp.]|jgi:uncharacterized membrane protein|nr:DUF1345 domain-containing protein [Sphingomicrobium sp.]
MAERRSIGNMVAPWRFIMFILVLAAAIWPASLLLGSAPLGIIASFDLAAVLFLVSCWTILAITDPRAIERIAQMNDANRTVLLVITVIVLAVLLIAMAAQTSGGHPDPVTKVLIIITLIIAWLFSNSVYALHYMHMAYIDPPAGCEGFRFPGTEEPVFWDFVYFAFTCGMAFATSDVEVANQSIRKVVAFHCLAAFAFNIGVLAFTVNLLASGGG